MAKTTKTKSNYSKLSAREKQEYRIEKQKKANKRVMKKITAPSSNPAKQLKPTKIKTTKLERNPMFIEFLNWKGDRFFIERLMDRLIFSFDRTEDKVTAENKKKNLNEEYLKNLESFQTVFQRNYQEAISSKGISDYFLTWLSNSSNYIEQQSESYLNDETIKFNIKDPSGRWLEAILCKNFIMTFNYFGIDIMKRCPICGSYFCHKGPYAKYCSDECKVIGMGPNG